MSVGTGKAAPALQRGRTSWGVANSFNKTRVIAIGALESNAWLRNFLLMLVNVSFVGDA